MALGLMAKPMLVTMPITLLLMDYWPLGRVASLRGPWWPRIREKWPLLALALVFGVVTFVTQRDARASLTDLTSGVRLATAVESYGTYLWNTVWAVGLAGLYPHPNSANWPAVGASLALMTVVTVLALRVTPRRPYLAAGWFWYLLTLSPVSGLLQAGLQVRADRFTYVPLVGISIAAAWGCAIWPPGRSLPA